MVRRLALATVPLLVLSTHVPTYASGTPPASTGGGVNTGAAGQIAEYATTGRAVSAATVSGDIGYAQGGAMTIANLAVTNAKIANGTIANAKLVNSSVTISGHTLSLGGTLSLASGDISGLAASATTDTTNAANISSGTLPTGRTAALTGDVTKAAGSTATTVTQINGTPCDTGFTLGPTGCTWTQTASNSASLAWTGLLRGNYVMYCVNILPATNNSTPYLQVGEGGTPTWQTSGYKWSAVAFRNSAVSGIGSTSDTGIVAGTSGVTQNTGNGDVINAVLSGLGSGAVMMATFNVGGDVDATPNYNGYTGSGKFPSDTTAKTALRLIMSSGNITSGSCTLRQGV